MDRGADAPAETEKYRAVGPEKEDAMLKNWTPPKQKDKSETKEELKALR